MHREQATDKLAMQEAASPILSGKAMLYIGIDLSISAIKMLLMSTSIITLIDAV
jgi:hypothetical protein